MCVRVRCIISEKLSIYTACLSDVRIYVLGVYVYIVYTHCPCACLHLYVCARWPCMCIIRTTIHSMMADVCARAQLSIMLVQQSSRRDKQNGGNTRDVAYMLVHMYGICACNVWVWCSVFLHSLSRRQDAMEHIIHIVYCICDYTLAWMKRTVFTVDCLCACVSVWTCGGW